MPALQFRSHFTNKDEKSKDLELIYTGVLNKKLFWVKFVSLTSSVVGLCMLPMGFMKCLENNNNIAAFGILTLMAVFTFGTPIFLHFITRSYALHIYYNKNKDNYIVERFTFFLRTNQIEFTSADVVTPTIDRMFASVLIKKQPVFMDYKRFSNFDHYYNIMGFDKPLDFKLEDSDEETVPVSADDKIKNLDNKR